jgi:DNA-binding GntR family transcriptional regulator
MMEAIKKRDVDLLKRLAQEHIQVGKEVILAEIEKGTIVL